MFDNMMKEKQRMNDKSKYVKSLGWNEFDETGDKVVSAIAVLDIDIGYAVFRFGSEGRKLLYHTDCISEAVEWGVDRARQEIADHEIKQVKKET